MSGGAGARGAVQQPETVAAQTLARETLVAQPSRSAAVPKKNRMGLIIGVLTFLPMVFILFMAGKGCTGSVEGQMQSVGKPHGDWQMTPTSCFSGEHESFFGVWVAPDLQDKDGHTGFIGGLKILKDPVGAWKVYVESPLECKNTFGCVIRPLDDKHCPTFDVSVRNTNTTINDIRVREGHANLDCTFPEGGTFKAQLKFDGCT